MAKVKKEVVKKLVKIKKKGKAKKGHGPKEEKVKKYRGQGR